MPKLKAQFKIPVYKNKRKPDQKKLEDIFESWKKTGQKLQNISLSRVVIEQRRTH